MSFSLRDQLLQAGLINKKQANEAERRQQRHERPQPHAKQTASHKPLPQGRPIPPLPPAPVNASAAARSAKLARDQVLNRQHHEKAQRKARLAEIKQLIQQNRIDCPDPDATYNFVDGTKIRRIAADAALRERMSRGEIVIVRHADRYDLVPAATAARIRERDEHAFIFSAQTQHQSTPDDRYKEFIVPDDLTW